MKHWVRILSLIFIVGVVIGYFLYPSLFPTSEEKLGSNAAAAPQGSGLLPVDIAILSPQSLEDKIITTGTLMASEETELHAEASGVISGIFFSEGQVVEKGALLITLNSEDLLAQRARLEAELSLAEKNASRQESLLSKGGTSAEQVDAARSQVVVLKAQLDVTRAEINKREVRAPYKGVIGLRYVSLGSYITPTSKTALLQKIDALKVEFSVPEKYFRSISIGDVITFTTTGSSTIYAATVYAFDPKVDENTRTITIRANVDNRDLALLPGLFASINYRLRSIDNALMVPTEALVPELKGQKVYLIKNGVIASRKVQTGIRTDVAIQLTEGVQPGDTVITTGILQVRDGMEVAIRNIVSK